MTTQSKDEPRGATPTTASDPAGEKEQTLRFRAGFLRVEPQIRGVPEEDLEPINLDVPTVVATVIGAYDEIIPFRPVLVEMPNFDIKNVDDLRDYAFALGYAHVGNRATSGPSSRATEIAGQLVSDRDRYVTDGMALAKRGLIPLELVEKHRSGSSYKSIAFDVLGLVRVFEDHWGQIESKSALTREELEHSTDLANELVAAVGRREQSAPAADASLVRQQAYTLLVRAYAEVRDALTYVRRRRGDVDDIAPSLWAGRGKRPPSESLPEDPADTPPAPVRDTPATTGANPKVPVGFPGSSPFSG